MFSTIKSEYPYLNAMTATKEHHRMELNPQAENGHVDIANEIAEALCREQLSGYESRVLWALFRKTYGWHKKEDRISLSQFQALTGLPIPKISNTLNRLVLRKMVSVTENGNGKVKSYGFQKVYSLWQGLPEKVIPKMGIPEKGITGNGVQGLPKSASTKETITKETITTTYAKTEQSYKDVFEEKGADLIRIFPQHDFEVLKGACLAHYRSMPPPLDPYSVIYKWFQREYEKHHPKGHQHGKHERHTSKREDFTDATTEEFLAHGKGRL